MDPITLIVTAIIAGTAAAAQETVGTAIKDAYNGLKALIQKRFEGKPAAQTALVESEKKPEVWKAPLTDALQETQADKDEAILKAAQRLLELVRPEESKAGKYIITIGSAQGTVIGDHAKVEQHFGEKSGKK